MTDIKEVAAQLNSLMPPKFVRVPLDPFPVERRQRNSCEDDRIKSGVTYLIKYNNNWFAGKFGKQWFGWVFHPSWGVSSIQLNNIEILYEMEE